MHLRNAHGCANAAGAGCAGAAKFFLFGEMSRLFSYEIMAARASEQKVLNKAFNIKSDVTQP